MGNLDSLLKECRARGAIFVLIGDRLKVCAKEPLPQELVDALRELKPQVKAAIQAEQRGNLDCWVLEEWRRTTIPQWRHILRTSIRQGDRESESYARWMLREILLDKGQPE